MGAERKSQYIAEKDKLATAYHEVGLTGWLLISHVYDLVGWARPCRIVYGWCNAPSQGYLRASGTCPRLCRLGCYLFNGAKTDMYISRLLCFPKMIGLPSL